MNNDSISIGVIDCHWSSNLYQEIKSKIFDLKISNINLQCNFFDILCLDCHFCFFLDLLKIFLKYHVFLNLCLDLQCHFGLDLHLRLKIYLIIKSDSKMIKNNSKMIKINSNKIQIKVDSKIYSDIIKIESKKIIQIDSKNWIEFLCRFFRFISQYLSTSNGLNYISFDKTSDIFTITRRDKTFFLLFYFLKVIL